MILGALFRSFWMTSLYSTIENQNSNMINGKKGVPTSKIGRIQLGRKGCVKVCRSKRLLRKCSAPSETKALARNHSFSYSGSEKFQFWPPSATPGFNPMSFVISQVDWLSQLHILGISESIIDMNWAHNLGYANRWSPWQKESKWTTEIPYLASLLQPFDECASILMYQFH